MRAFLRTAMVTLGLLALGASAETAPPAAEKAVVNETNRRCVRYRDLRKRIEAAVQRHQQSARDNDTAAILEVANQYRAVLTDLDKEKYPEDWVVVQANLGIIAMGQGMTTLEVAHYAEAVAAFRAALQERSRAPAALDWEALQIMLGQSLSKWGVLVGGSEEQIRLKAALAVFQTLLQAPKVRRTPKMFLQVQEELNSALWLLGVAENDRLLLENALTRMRRLWNYPRDSQEWAWARGDLGYVQLKLGEAESGRANLVAALKKIRQAVAAMQPGKSGATQVEVRSWLIFQLEQMEALHALGEREMGTLSLRAALKVAEKVQKEIPSELWEKMSHVRLLRGSVLTTLGERENDSKTLFAAVAALDALAQESSRIDDAMADVEGQSEQARARLALGERMGGTQDLEIAVMRLQEVLQKPYRISVLEAFPKERLARALATLGSRRQDRATLAAAVSMAKEAVAQVTRTGAPWYWAKAQSTLAYALYCQGEASKDPDTLAASIIASKATLLERHRPDAPLQWAETQHNLGRALTLAGKLQGDAKKVREGNAALRAALAVYVRAGMAFQAERVRADLRYHSLPLSDA